MSEAKKYLVGMFDDDDVLLHAVEHVRELQADAVGEIIKQTGAVDQVHVRRDVAHRVFQVSLCGGNHN